MQGGKEEEIFGVNKEKKKETSGNKKK